MPVELEFVETIGEIRDAVRVFNEQAAVDPKLTRSLLTGTKYWVYDPETKRFGPSKFVGFVDLRLADYGRARNRERSGVRFDGYSTRVMIEGLLGAYEVNPNLPLS